MKSSRPRQLAHPPEEGITSYVLASPHTAGGAHLTVRLVEIEPGALQRTHCRAPEQIYFILEGNGRMTVGDDARDVGPGDCVFIPSHASHGLENHSDRTLQYLSAASPADDSDWESARPDEDLPADA